MATVLSDDRTAGGADPSRPWRFFSEAERRQMLKDDMGAGVTVALILTGVIVAGMLLLLVGVTLSL